MKNLILTKDFETQLILESGPLSIEPNETEKNFFQEEFGKRITLGTQLQTSGMTAEITEITAEGFTVTLDKGGNQTITLDNLYNLVVTQRTISIISK